MSVVEVDVLPSKGLPGHLPGHLAIWRQQKGSIFSTYIGKRSRDMLVNFIACRSQILPVRVSLVMLDRPRPSSVYPTMLDGTQKVGFIHQDFFILFNRDDLRQDIQEEIGETIYSREQILKLVYN